MGNEQDEGHHLRPELEGLGIEKRQRGDGHSWRRFWPTARSRGVEKASKFEELVLGRSKNDQRIVLTVPPRSIGRTSGQVGRHEVEGVLREIEMEVGRSSQVG